LTPEQYRLHRYTGRVSMSVLFLLFFAFSLSAADLSGIWNGQTVDRNGDAQDVSFRFVQKGDVLTGKIYGDNASSPISDVKIEGDRISFSVNNELNGQVTTFTYTGTILSPTEIELSRQRVGRPGGGANVNRPNFRQIFKLRKIA